MLSWVCLEIEQHCHATAASDNRDRKHELQRVMSWHSLGLVRSGSGGTLPVYPQVSGPGYGGGGGTGAECLPATTAEVHVVPGKHLPTAFFSQQFPPSAVLNV